VTYHAGGGRPEAVLDPRSLGVYVLTSTGYVPGRGHLEVGLAAIEGGATAVQLRAPALGDGDLLPIATELASRCRDAGVLFLVNDRVDVAVAAGADGAHVGHDDDPVGARERLGPERVLGVSVLTLAQAESAEAAGADYLGVTVWATTTKPEAVPVDLDGLRAIVRSTLLPVVGIGGIHIDNVHEVLAAGATGVAVVSAVGAAPDPIAATARFAELVHSFDPSERPDRP
jgi:thiamine-phosphate pyrophosphorylase